ncbi:HD domain-containing protein [Haloprofundus sp. MHR1]|uniref:HD domain-containing protein n=1 Tax=Haloprofundus sp. MHR1 TaxID=2572921 RepID=UPI0010BF16F0|nr:HD domain-containing protein [Haloprofundus sp. MHR1]QCJ46429.1 HD domain-containing protein [Haloprofundus sp. MHR1]
MNAIKDSVHDYISVDPVARALLDTPELQRLRHIKQLSTVRLVYPSANHTRFEHSLGVYHLASRALDHLGVDDDRAAHVRAAALLHDIGHGPYGHQTEEVIMRRTGEHHDEIGDLLASSAAGDVLRAHGLDPERVAELVRGEGDLGQLVSGELDVDRMDYLVRDAHHSGVPYGTIDHGRLVRALRLREGRLVLAEGNVQTAESMLLARSLMNGVVYRHHVSRIAGAMLDRASERLLDETDLSVRKFRRMADHDLLVELGREVPDFGRRIERRDLYKRAVWAGLWEVPAWVPDIGHDDVRAAERDVADAAGVDPDDVIVDVPSRPTLKESETHVVVDGTVRWLEEASELVGALRNTERAQWRLGVYAPDEHVEAVGDAAAAILDVDD